jgi:hypothetical protein
MHWTKPQSTKAKAATFFWRASAPAQNVFTAYHPGSALGLQKNAASQLPFAFNAVDYHGALSGAVPMASRYHKNIITYGWNSSQNLRCEWNKNNF